MRYSRLSMRRPNNRLLKIAGRVSRSLGYVALFGILQCWAQPVFALDITVRGGVHDNFNRLVFDWPQAPKYSIARSDDGLVKLIFKGAATSFALTPSAQRLSRIVDFSVTPQADGTLVQFRVASQAMVKDFLSGSAVVIDVTGSGVPAKILSTAVSETKSEPQPQDAPLPTPAPMLAVAAPASLPAVLYERAARSYALLDKRGKLAADTDIAALEGVAGWQRPTQDDAVLMVGLLNGTQPKIVARPATQIPDAKPLAITAQADYAAGGRVLVNVQNAGSIMSFIDPVIGDTLYAITTPPGQFINVARHYTAFELLPTRQGVVVRPLDDKLTLKLTPDGLELSMPGGLKLSPPTATSNPSAQPAEAEATVIEAPTVEDKSTTTENSVAAEAAQAPAAHEPFFDVIASQAKNGETFTVARQRLQTAVAAVGSDDPAMRAIARMNLARFYLANAYGQEADGLLKDIAADTPDLTTKPEFRGLRGMARTLTEDSDGALEDFNLPELADYPDLAIWRGIALAKARNFTKASPIFANILELLAHYPEPFFSHFTQLAGESFLATNDNDNAKRIISILKELGGEAALKRPAIIYMQGVIESRVGSLETAKKLWEQVADTQDMLTRTRAQMALVDLGVAAKTIAPMDAAKQLERLRFGWRGDSLELDLLQRLASAYASAGQLDEALGSLEKAKRIAPSKTNTDLIETQERQIFADLFMSKAIDDYPPLKTLATYNRYKQFAPLDSEKALAVNNRLVDKMLKIDLLGQAADLLDQQVPATTDAAAKGKLGARIAGIRILNLEPVVAIKTLDATDAKDFPLDLVEERRLLRARALADSGQVKLALDLLSGDGSDDAKRLTATITWRAKDWPAAAASLVGLIPAADSLRGGDKLTSDQAQFIVRRAVALTLAGDTTGLMQLNNDYGAAIKATPSAASFALLTAPEGAIKALAALPSEMKDVDLFKDFLENYRK